MNTQWWVIPEPDGVRVTTTKQPGAIGPFDSEAAARAYAVQSQD